MSAASRPAGAWLLEAGAEEAARSQVHEKARQTGEITGIDVGGLRRAEPDEPLVDERDELRRAPERRPEHRPEPPAERLRDPRSERSEERRPERAPDPEPPRRWRPDAEEPSTGSMGSMGGLGATGILARKLEAEAGRLGPMVDALVAKGLVADKDLAADDDEFDDDDEVSVASFKDDRPRDEANGVTPMRIVEEIRRLRRIQEILLSKGLVSETEIQAASSDD